MQEVVVRQALKQRLGYLVDDFSTYVALNEQLTYRKITLLTHRTCLARLNQVGLDQSVGDDDYIKALRRVLVAWSAFRKSTYPTTDELKAVLSSRRRSLGRLSGLSIEDPDLGRSCMDALWDELIGITSDLGRTGKPPLVGGSKILHHLLPNLMPPIDRAYTGWFMGWSDGDDRWKKSARSGFEEIYEVFRTIALATSPSQYVTGTGWQTATAKIVDNGFIAFK